MRAKDESLVAKAQSGDKYALDEILERFKSLAKSKTRIFAAPGLEHDDILQEGMIGLFKAVRDFSPDIGAPFVAFADMCIERQITSAIRAANRKKHNPLNTSVPYKYSEDGDAGDALRDRTAINPLSAVINKEEIKRVSGALTATEAAVLGLRLNDKTYQEIAEVLGVSVKSVDNALQRAKQKIGQ